MDEPRKTRAGLVALLGRTNAGKSTLVNRIVGGRVAITGDRPQVTRRVIRGIRTYADEGIQLVLADVPGLHKPKDALSDGLIARARAALRDADGILLAVEAGDRSDGATRYAVEALPAPGSPIPVVLAITKSDLHSATEVQETLRSVSALYPFAAKHAVSSENGDGIAALEKSLKGLCREGPFLFPADRVTDLTREERAAEIVREKLIHALRDEVPHAAHVVVDELAERPDGMLFIACSIHVERPSQKGIVIGKGGSMIKRIGEQAREELEFLSKKKVYLKTEVKVRAGWRSDNSALREFKLE